MTVPPPDNAEALAEKVRPCIYGYALRRGAQPAALDALSELVALAKRTEAAESQERHWHRLCNQRNAEREAAEARLADMEYDLRRIDRVRVLPVGGVKAAFEIVQGIARAALVTSERAEP